MSEAYDKALSRLAKYCAQEDRCRFQVNQKLRSMNDLTPSEKENILNLLLTEGFIDDARFAESFARGKFRINQWGKVKIRAELYQRDISSSTIDKALTSIDEGEYTETIERLCLKYLSYHGTPNNKVKLLRYLTQKGYEPNVFMPIVNTHLTS